MFLTLGMASLIARKAVNWDPEENTVLNEQVVDGAMALGAIVERRRPSNGFWHHQICR